MGLRLPDPRAPKVDLVTIGRSSADEYLMLLTAGGKVREFRLTKAMVARLIREGVAAIVT